MKLYNIIGLFVFMATLLFPNVSFGEEKRIKIAIIDTGLQMFDSVAPYLCEKSLHKDFTGQGMSDIVGHGTNITGIIASKINSKKHCIVIIKWFHSRKNYSQHSTEHRNDVIVLGIRYAVSIKAKYINLSLSGYKPNTYEKYEIGEALKLGIKVIVAAGNSAQNLSIKCNAFPACYKFQSEDFYVVANYYGQLRAKLSNYGGPVNYYEDGTDVTAGGRTFSGTSQSAARCTGNLVRFYD